MPDPELEAMAAVSEVLERLEAPARERVVRWTASKFEVGLGQSSPTRTGVAGSVIDRASEAGEFADVGDLVHAAQPPAGPERALVVAYWFQEVRGQDGWTGADINSTLKNMGLGLANVTKTLDSLKNRKPALVMQVSKAGRSRQARKTYKLTTAGVRFVSQMIANTAAGEAA